MTPEKLSHDARKSHEALVDWPPHPHLNAPPLPTYFVPRVFAHEHELVTLLGLPRVAAEADEPVLPPELGLEGVVCREHPGLVLVAGRAVWLHRVHDERGVVVGIGPGHVQNQFLHRRRGRCLGLAPAIVPAGGWRFGWRWRSLELEWGEVAVRVEVPELGRGFDLGRREPDRPLRLELALQAQGVGPQHEHPLSHGLGRGRWGGGRGGLGLGQERGLVQGAPAAPAVPPGDFPRAAALVKAQLRREGGAVALAHSEHHPLRGVLRVGHAPRPEDGVGGGDLGAVVGQVPQEPEVLRVALDPGLQ
mmetsp:Transcript_45528/g.102823  ORF Transcript_45528/g.102823 Transcript_45528/m.102823 type:complete len:305 (-) Transcript_45528:249-1163(-)